MPGPLAIHSRASLSSRSICVLVGSSSLLLLIWIVLLSEHLQLVLRQRDLLVRARLDRRGDGRGGLRQVADGGEGRQAAGERPTFADVGDAAQLQRHLGDRMAKVEQIAEQAHTCIRTSCGSYVTNGKSLSLHSIFPHAGLEQRSRHCTSGSLSRMARRGSLPSCSR